MASNGTLTAIRGVRVGHAQDRRRRTGTTVVLLDPRSEEHTSELQSLTNLVCRLLLEKKKKKQMIKTKKKKKNNSIKKNTETRKTLIRGKLTKKNSNTESAERTNEEFTITS